MLRDMLNYLVSGFKNASLQTKLIFSYFLLIFIPILTLSLFSSSRNMNLVREQTADLTELYLAQANRQVETELAKMESVSKLITVRSDIRAILEKKGRSLPFEEQREDMDDLIQALTDLRDVYGIYQVRLYVDDSFLYSKRNNLLYSLADLEGTDWYSDFLGSYEARRLLPPYPAAVAGQPTQRVVSVVSPIRSLTNFNDILGLVSVDLPEEDLLALIETARLTPEGAVWLLDDTGTAICRSEAGELPADTLTGLYARAQAQPGVRADGDWFCGMSEPTSQGLRLFLASPGGRLIRSGLDFQTQLLLLSVLVGILVYVMAYFYARSSTRRIRMLTRQFRKVESGNLDVRCIVDSGDEIGELQNGFNFVVRRIRYLLDEQYNMGKNLKEMELRALQAQINPHFLYNTLDLISWKAKKLGDEEICGIVVMLAQYYRLTLSNGGDFLSLKDEFEHIRLYTRLQNLRLERPVSLDARLDPTVEGYPIMKLVLQPIVENSIQHGIAELEDRPGELRLTARREGTRVVITVTDNGAGMDRRTLVAIRSHNDGGVQATGVGFGLFNVIDRLKLYYGTSYDFEIESRSGEGTRVVIRVPDPPPGGAAGRRTDDPQVP